MTANRIHPINEIPITARRRLSGIAERFAIWIALGPSGSNPRNEHFYGGMPRPQVPRFVSAITLLIGICLALTPLLWMQDGRGWLPAGLNELLAGFAVALLGALSLSRSIGIIAATFMGCMIGTWSIISPFLLDYGSSATYRLATIVEIVAGVSLLTVTELGFISARAKPER